MLKILIVEDDPMVAQMNIDFCSRMNREKEITHVRTVAEATKFLLEHSCDLILLDVFLPNQSGLELLVTLRTQNRYIPVILITASDENETLKKAYAYGVIDYLIKPFSVQRFDRAISKFLTYHEIAKNKNHTDQQTLDRFFNSEQEEQRDIRTNQDQLEDNEMNILPKGLSKLTLKKVYTVINEQSDWFSTEDIVKNMRLSRISIKKYIQFLVDESVLTEELSYQSVGRPITIYRMNKDSRQFDYLLTN